MIAIFVLSFFIAKIVKSSMDHNIGAHSYFWTNLIIFNPKKGFYYFFKQFKFFCSIMDVRYIIHSNKMLLNIKKI